MRVVGIPFVGLERRMLGACPAFLEAKPNTRTGQTLHLSQFDMERGLGNSREFACGALWRCHSETPVEERKGTPQRRGRDAADGRKRSSADAEERVAGHAGQEGGEQPASASVDLMTSNIGRFQAAEVQRLLRPK